MAGNFSVGMFGNYRDLTVDYPDALVGSRSRANGWTVGLDATYDVGSWYIRGIGSYAWLSADSRRDFSIGESYRKRVWPPGCRTCGLSTRRAGARFDLGSSWITPYRRSRLYGHEPEGVLGDATGSAPTRLRLQHEHQTSGVIGIKWAGNLGGIVPEAKVAYRYDFNRDLGVDAYFVDAPAGADFRKSENYKRGSILAGLSLAGTLGSNLTGRIGYLGQFNSDYTDHASMDRWSITSELRQQRRLRRSAPAVRLRRHLRRRRRARTER